MTVAARAVGPQLTAALEPLVASAAARGHPTLASATLAVGSLDPVALYDAARTSGASLWRQPSSGSALVGIGEAWSVHQGQRGRFAAVSAAWRGLLADAVIAGAGPRGRGPLLLGAFGFDDVPPNDGVWEPFGPGRMVLPALLLTSTPAGAWLTASMVVHPDGPPPAFTVAALEETWSHVIDLPARPAPPDQQTLRVVAREPEPAAWRDSVARLAGAVGRGRLDKAVLSREVRLRGSADIDVGSVVRRLDIAAPESTVFALPHGGSTFIGATPERLVRLEGRSFETVAMAGSARRSSDPETDERLAVALVESDKEREEHAVVVDMIRRTLAPMAERLEVPSTPSVEKLRHVQHLVTRIRGDLREDADILSLVERLHPTPAVGGMPRELALELIAEEESHDRGWYAGPLGWVDRHGDGEFVVALRSGVVRGDSATLFAGCGIVADSDPEREWDESTAKLQALGSALGRIET